MLINHILFLQPICPLVTGRLEVTLAKEDEGFMWTEVVVGHSGGEYVADPDQARLIHERLAHLTSDERVSKS